jgi:hypothetical protein
LCLTSTSYFTFGPITGLKVLTTRARESSL